MNGRLGVSAAVALAAAVYAFLPAHAQNARGCNLPPPSHASFPSRQSPTPSSRADRPSSCGRQRTPARRG